MKLQSLIIDMLLLAAVIAMYNGFGLMGGSAYDPKYNISQSAVNGITQIDTSQAGGDKSWFEENIPGASAFMWLSKLVSFLGSIFLLILTFGSIIPQYIPGDVGVAFGLIVNTIMLFIVAWSGMQIYMKISTKYMD